MEPPHPTAADDQARYYAWHLGNSMRVIAVAPGYLRATQETNDSFRAGIMIDAFYVNLRLLAEFLLSGGRPEKDVGMRTFGVDRWSPPKTAKQPLKEYRETASKFVIHYGLRRVPAEDPTGLVPGFAVDTDTVASMVRDVLTAMEEFIALVPDDAAKRILWEAYDWAQTELAHPTWAT